MFLKMKDFVVSYLFVYLTDNFLLCSTVGGDSLSDTSSDYGSEASFPRSDMSNIYGMLDSVASSLSSGTGSLKNFGAEVHQKRKLYGEKMEDNPVTKNI